MNVSTSKGVCDTFRTICLEVLEILDTPVSLSIALQIEYNLCITSEVLPINYECPLAYLKDAQAIAIFKKNPWFFTHIPEDLLYNKAIEKFMAAEAQCALTNLRLRDSRAKAPWAMYLHSARRFCEKILGQCQYGTLGFSPGASTALKGKDAHILGKLRTPPHCTGRAYQSVVKAVLQDMPHYALACGLLKRDRTDVQLDTSVVEVHDFNVFTAVPKDSRSHRGIAIEPPGNMLLQKGFGDQIKARLKRFGYDLETMQDKHGDLARSSSLNDRFATIDLATASDTVSLELVKEILPFDWFYELRKLRCDKTMVSSFDKSESTIIVNEKFSSMGNGFTFELETLVFLCLGLAVREIHGSSDMVVSVYGDDIVIDKTLAERMISLLEFCGFTTNVEKTFIAGTFKESCGEDYLNGVRVRPTYIKELPDDDILKTVAFANRLRQISHNLGFGHFCDMQYRKLWRSVVQRLPLSKRLFGPPGLGDEVINANSDESRKCREIRGNVLQFRYYARKPHRREKVHGSPCYTLCCALYGVSSSGVIARGTKYAVVVRTVRVSQCLADTNGYDWL